jgi:iron complex outermembrane recepter protein
MLGSFSGPPAFLDYDPKTSADVSETCKFNDNVKLTVGATNIFDEFPDRQNLDETDNGHVLDGVQFGLKSTSYFVRLAVKFRSYPCRTRKAGKARAVGRGLLFSGELWTLGLFL